MTTTIRRVDDLSGFSLIELMITLTIVLMIAGAVFQTISMTTQRSAAEQTKVDMFQEAREFMDQMSRDLIHEFPGLLEHIHFGLRIHGSDVAGSSPGGVSESAQHGPVRLYEPDHKGSPCGGRLGQC